MKYIFTFPMMKYYFSFPKKYSTTLLFFDAKTCLPPSIVLYTATDFWPKDAALTLNQGHGLMHSAHYLNVVNSDNKIFENPSGIEV